jgi:predicted RNase H-like nuclease
MTFLGVDLGWHGRPSGVARLMPFRTGRLATHAEVLEWIDQQAGTGPAVVAVDAPLVIPNKAGMRPAEKAMHRAFGRYHAGCYPSHQGMPFAENVRLFSHSLLDRGFAHLGREPRGQIEVHPHAASVQLFRLDRIIKYKRGTVAERRMGLERFRGLLEGLLREPLPAVPSRGSSLKAVEDMLDASLCAYLAWNWWHSGEAGNQVFGDAEQGYIVVPNRAS